MRIGTMFLGKVDSLGGESVQTKFFILGVPLVPLSSHYVLSEAVAGIRGFEIPLDGKSVLLGYVRIYAWLGALLFGIFAYVERHDAGGMWVGCLLCAATAGFTTFGMGGLSRSEKQRRSFLKEVTGIGTPPGLLPVDLRKETAKRLSEQWKSDRDGQSWTKAIEKGEAEPLLYAVALYSGKRELAEQVLARLVSGGSSTSAGPYR